MQLFADFVASALERDATPDGHRYLLIDTAATRPSNIASELGQGSQAIDILTGETCVWRESASPVLVELPTTEATAMQRQCVAATLTKWRYANCFVFVESPYAQDAAIRFFRERTEAVLTQDIPVLLRYFDSRVFGVLLNALHPDQRSTFLAAGTRWAVPGRRGENQCIDLEANATAADLTVPIQLDSNQEAILIDAGEADAMVDLLLNQNNAALLGLLPPEQHERISAALDAAAKFGIEQLADQVAFCTSDIALAPGFHDLQPWPRWMPEVRAGSLRFTDALVRAAQAEAV